MMDDLLWHEHGLFAKQERSASSVRRLASLENRSADVLVEMYDG